MDKIDFFFYYFLNFFPFEKKASSLLNEIKEENPISKPSHEECIITFSKLPTLQNILSYSEIIKNTSEVLIDKSIKESDIFNVSNPLRKKKSPIKRSFLKDIKEKNKNSHHLCDMDDIEILGVLKNLTGVLNIWNSYST